MRGSTLALKQRKPYWVSPVRVGMTRDEAGVIVPCFCVDVAKSREERRNGSTVRIAKSELADVEERHWGDVLHRAIEKVAKETGLV